MKKKIYIPIITILVIVLAIIYGWYGYYYIRSNSIPPTVAIEKYNKLGYKIITETISSPDSENKKLYFIISSEQKIIDTLVTESKFSGDEISKRKSELLNFPLLHQNVRIENNTLKYNLTSYNGKTKIDIINSIPGSIKPYTTIEEL